MPRRYGKAAIRAAIDRGDKLPIHLLPKAIQHTIFLSYVKGRRRVVGLQMKDGEEILATVEDVSIDLVVLNTDIEHPDARPRAHRCVRITDIESLAVRPIPSTPQENSK